MNALSRCARAYRVSRAPRLNRTRDSLNRVVTASVQSKKLHSRRRSRADARGTVTSASRPRHASTHARNLRYRVCTFSREIAGLRNSIERRRHKLNAAVNLRAPQRGCGAERLIVRSDRMLKPDHKCQKILGAFLSFKFRGKKSIQSFGWWCVAVETRLTRSLQKSHPLTHCVGWRDREDFCGGCCRARVWSPLGTRSARLLRRGVRGQATPNVE